MTSHYFWDTLEGSAGVSASEIGGGIQAVFLLTFWEQRRGRIVIFCI